MVLDERETQRAERRAAADRGDPDLLAEFAHDMDTQAARNRERDRGNAALGQAATPLDWAAVAAWVSDDVWERILNDTTASRAQLEAIRPSKLNRQPELSAAEPQARPGLRAVR